MRFHRIDYARIEREAVKRRCTLEALSEAAGLSPTTISNAIARRGRLRAETIHKIADLLGIEAVDLLIPIDPETKEDTNHDNHSNDRAGELAGSG